MERIQIKCIVCESLFRTSKKHPQVTCRQKKCAATYLRITKKLYINYRVKLNRAIAKLSKK